MKEIIVLIDKDGNPNIEVNGVDDNSCLTETKPLEEALGKVSNRSRKNAAYVAKKETVKVKI